MGRGSKRDYFRSLSTMQFPSTEYNFRQHLLHQDTSLIPFSMNELKMLLLVDNTYLLFLSFKGKYLSSISVTLNEENITKVAFVTWM